MDTLDLAVNYQKSSSSTLSDASSCGTNQSISGSQTKRKDSPKYHSIIRNRLRKDATISRSKSFQEQDVRKTSNARFYILRRHNAANDFDNFELNKTISHHNIEITIEDTDANEQPINHNTLMQCGRKKCNQIECSSLNSSEVNVSRQKVRSRRLLGRLFRRMRTLSMAWRKPKNKTQPRGELKF